MQRMYVNSIFFFCDMANDKSVGGICLGIINKSNMKINSEAPNLVRSRDHITSILFSLKLHISISLFLCGIISLSALVISPAKLSFVCRMRVGGIVGPEKG